MDRSAKNLLVYPENARPLRPEGRKGLKMLIFDWTAQIAPKTSAVTNRKAAARAVACAAIVQENCGAG